MRRPTSTVGTLLTTVMLQAGTELIALIVLAAATPIIVRFAQHGLALEQPAARTPAVAMPWDAPGRLRLGPE